MLLALASLPNSFWGALVVIGLLMIVGVLGVWKGYGL
jgi:hypothetical protein